MKYAQNIARVHVSICACHSGPARVKRHVCNRDTGHYRARLGRANDFALHSPYVCLLRFPCWFAARPEGGQRTNKGNTKEVFWGGAYVVQNHRSAEASSAGASAKADVHPYRPIPRALLLPSASSDFTSATQMQFDVSEQSNESNNFFVRKRPSSLPNHSESSDESREAHLRKRGER